MIKPSQRHDEYSYRFAVTLDESVTHLEDGQFLTIKGGKAVISDGSQKSFMSITSIRKGRDNLQGVSTRVAEVYVGAICVPTDQFDASKTYGDMTPLKINKDGVVAPKDPTADAAAILAGYAMGKPENGFLEVLVLP